MDKKQVGDNAAGNDGRIAKKERLVVEARKFNLLSNVFMSVALDDKLACQHVVRVLTGIHDLKVIEVRPQYRVSKVASHDAVLDILAEDSSGRLFCIEIQRADTVDHARRTRFYGAMVDSEYLMKGEAYASLPDVYIIYISETDLWGAGNTAYPVKKYFGDTGIPYDDGQHILYVNAAVDDGTEAARLMQYFRTANPGDMSQGDLSRRVHFLKCEEGGYDIMCEVSEKIYREGREEGHAEGRAEGRAEGHAEGKITAKREMASNMHKKGYADSTIADLLEVSTRVVRQWIGGSATAK